MGRAAQRLGIPGSPPDLRAVPSGCAFHPRCPLGVRRLPHRRLPLLRAAQCAGSEQLVACHLYDPAYAPSAPRRPASSRRATRRWRKGAARDDLTVRQRSAIARSSAQPPPQHAERADSRGACICASSFPCDSVNPVRPEARRARRRRYLARALPGRATALVGESGSGKTTVARMLARLYDANQLAHPLRGAARQRRRARAPCATIAVTCRWSSRTRSRRSIPCMTCAIT